MNKYYTIGKVEVPEDGDEVFAKSTQNKREQRYWIKRATTGPDAGHLLNPWGIHYQQGIDNKRVSSFMGKRRYEYSSVTADAFEMYLNFLETRNELYFRQAEREVN